MKLLLTAAFAMAFQTGAWADTVARPILPVDADVVVSQLAGDSARWSIGAFAGAGASYSTLLGIDQDSVVDSSSLLFTSLPDCAGFQLVDCGSVNSSVALASSAPADGGFGTLSKFAVGVGDRASLSGRTDLLAQPVVLPEPQSLVLVLAALALVGMATRLPRPRG